MLTRTKSALWGIFDPTMTFILDFLTPKFKTFILATKSVIGKSLVKFRQQIPIDIMLAMFV